MAGLSSTAGLNVFSEWLGQLANGSSAQVVAMLSGVTVVGSNLVSNVPFVVLVRDTLLASSEPPLMRLVLSRASELAANLTIPGSVATFIVLRAAGKEDTIGFLHFSMIGLPVTLLTTSLGAALLWWIGAPTPT